MAMAELHRIRASSVDLTPGRYPLTGIAGRCFFSPMNRMTSGVSPALLAGLLLTASVHAQGFAGSQRFSTEFRGAAMSLDVVNGGPQNDFVQLSASGNFTGQQWTVQARAGGFVQLTTTFRGANQCLDVVNGGPWNNHVALRPCGNFSGQQWRLDRTPQGFYQLTTAFRGPRMCLDIVNGGPRNNFAALRRCGNFSGQQWQIRAFTP